MRFVSFALCMLFPLAAGCGGGDEFSHDQGQKLYIEAMKVRTTDEAKCVDLLTQVIEADPIGGAYFHRAWIFAKRGSIDEAQDDVTAGLAIDTENNDLKWLDGELKKPANQRSLKMPPSSIK